MDITGKCRVVKLQSPAHDSSIQFAIVVYEKEDDASKAVDKLDNKEFKNSVLKCCLKLPKGENQPPKQT
jgi:RNA recognition motif-containing protein